MDKLSFDINHTKAILIGASNFESFPNILPAINNIDDLERLLLNEKILGLPKGNIIKLVNLRHDDIFERLRDFLADQNNIEIETLFFYYVGHGFRETKSKELYLTGRNSKQNSIKVSAIPFNEIKELIENSSIQRRVLIIDACHSGLAAMSISDEKYTDEELDVRGTYVLTSSAGDEKSLFDTGHRNTFFTAELLKVMRNGISNTQECISLDNIFDQLQKNLARAKLPRPQRKTNINSTGFNVFLNPGFDRQKYLELEGDNFFARGDYELAKTKYIEASKIKPNAHLKNKIGECTLIIRRNLEQLLIKNQNELDQKKETELNPKEQALKLKKKIEDNQRLLGLKQSMDQQEFNPMTLNRIVAQYLFGISLGLVIFYIFDLMGGGGESAIVEGFVSQFVFFYFATYFNERYTWFSAIICTILFSLETSADLSLRRKLYESGIKINDYPFLSMAYSLIWISNKVMIDRLFIFKGIPTKINILERIIKRRLD